MREREFEGGVFSAAIEGGRAGAQLSLGGDAVRAVTADGAEFRVPYAGCQLELGGASGNMWFCRTPDKSLTLFSEAPGFAAALRESARRELGPAIEQIEQQQQRGARRGALLWLSLLTGAALALAAAFYGIRQAGRSAVDVLPPSVDEQLGELAFEHMSLEGRVLEDGVVQGAVQQAVDRLAAHVPKDFKFRVRVVDASIVNAFALPGGFVVVYTGLLRAAEKPEQLAGVLGHELAHVTRRHGMHRIAQSIGVVAAIQLLFGDVSGLAAVAVEVLRAGAINTYSRDQEHEADMDAVRTLAAAGIDPVALADFFALLQRREPDLPSVVSWLGTHPDLGQRIEDVKRAAQRVQPKHREPLAFDWAEVQRRAGKSTDADAGR